MAASKKENLNIFKLFSKVTIGNKKKTLYMPITNDKSLTLIFLFEQNLINHEYFTSLCVCSFYMNKKTNVHGYVCYCKRHKPAYVALERHRKTTTIIEVNNKSHYHIHVVLII